MAEKEKILVTYDWDRTYGEPWPVFHLSALERLDNDYLDAVARRIERAMNPLAEDEGAVQAVCDAMLERIEGDWSIDDVPHLLAALDRYLASK